MINRIQKLALGSVQWGLEYGISNLNGKSSPEEVREILTLANKYEINLIDTAPVYGEAEQIIGSIEISKEFLLISKSKKICQPVIDTNLISSINETLLLTLNKMRVRSLYGFLIHNPSDFFLPGSELLVEYINLLKAEGLVEKIGVSVYDYKQIENILTFFVPDIIQLPINVFDQRLLKLNR